MKSSSTQCQKAIQKDGLGIVLLLTGSNLVSNECGFLQNKKLEAGAGAENIYLLKKKKKENTIAEGTWTPYNFI